MIKRKNPEKRNKMVRTQKEEIAIINTELKFIKEKLEENNTQHKEIKEMLSGFIDSLDKKYAKKQVETIVYGMVGLIMIAFLTAVINMVLISG